MSIPSLSSSISERCCGDVRMTGGGRLVAVSSFSEIECGTDGEYPPPGVGALREELLPENDLVDRTDATDSLRPLAPYVLTLYA